MLRFQAGEADCFESLVARYRKPLLGYVYRMVQNAAWSEEIAQEAFLRVYLHRGRYEPQARFSTWLYRIATHLALNHLRDHRHDRRAASLDAPVGESEAPREFADARPSCEQELLEEEKRARIRATIGRLPERQRAAVVMHKYQGLDYAEIAATLRLSESATKSLLFRAYESLRRDLRDLL